MNKTQPKACHITLGPDEYVSGDINTGWPDGEWPIKLPDARVTTIETRAGSTSGLSLFIWNSLSPGAELTLHPPTATSPGALTVDRAKPVQTTSKPRRLLAELPDPDDSDEILLLAVQRALDRLGTPISFEHLWAMLTDRDIAIDASDLIALTRRVFSVDDFGLIRSPDESEIAVQDFRPDDCRWDNIEQAYWELHRAHEPPHLERMYRKRKSSVHDGMEYHLDDIQHDLLSAAQEARLGTTIRIGQEAADELRQGEAEHLRKVELGIAIRDADIAREEFLMHNLRLVFNNAVKYEWQIRNSSLELADLVQAGYGGLLRAVEKFDPERGLKFSTYATWWIKQAIARQIGDRGRTIRIPIHVHDNVRTVQRAEHGLEISLGRVPTVAEVSEATGLTPTAIKTVLHLHEVADLADAGDQTVPDIDEQVIEAMSRTSFHEAVDSSLAHIDSRMALIIRYRFGLIDGLSYTLEQIGDILGVTRERVRQLEKKALEKLAKSDEISVALRELDPPTEQTAIVRHGSLTEAQKAAWLRLEERARIIEATNRE